MIDRLKLSLGGVWMIAALSALILPIFLPSFADAPGYAGNAIALSNVTLFLLGLPMTLVAIPLIWILNFALGVSPGSIGVDYMNVLLLFLIGLAQWFWIVPRLFGSRSDIQRLEFPQPLGNVRLAESKFDECSIDKDRGDMTPLERVLRSDD